MHVIGVARLWLSQDPVTAFHYGRVVTHYVAIGWDTVAMIYNALRDVVILAYAARRSGLRALRAQATRAPCA